MLNGVTVGTNNLKNAIAFYDAVLSHVGLVRLMQNDVEAGYGLPDGKSVFFVIKPFNKEPATFGNGSQTQFLAESESKVVAFYQTVLDLGGFDEGAPGLRSYRTGYYGAYCRDLDGNKLHAAYEPQVSHDIASSGYRDGHYRKGQQIDRT